MAPKRVISSHRNPPPGALASRPIDLTGGSSPEPIDLTGDSSPELIDLTNDSPPVSDSNPISRTGRVSRDGPQNPRQEYSFNLIFERTEGNERKFSCIRKIGGYDAEHPLPMAMGTYEIYLRIDRIEAGDIFSLAWKLPAEYSDNGLRPYFRTADNSQVENQSEISVDVSGKPAIVKRKYGITLHDSSFKLGQFQFAPGKRLLTVKGGLQD